MTPQARSGAPFELLRFEATPISGALVVLELEGRFRTATRFGRPPVLVVEPGEDQRRIELTPIRTLADGQRWEAAYAAPAEALAPGTRLSLGLRGTLLELPPPDEPDDGERFTAVAREANRLRRELERAEADAASVRAELGAAVSAARDEALAGPTERIAALEQQLEAATTHNERALAEATARAEAAETRATEAETRVAEAETRVAEAEARATQAEEARQAAEAEPFTAEMASVIDADALEQELNAAREGIDVLRAELVEERERSQVAIAELEQQLDAAREDDGDGDAPAEPETRVLHAAADPTRPFTVAEQRDADDDATQPFGPSAEPKAPREATLHDLIAPDGHDPAQRHGPNLSRWVAVAALALFAFVLLGLLVGFLG
ncbi:hypothetical protein DSM104299_05616 [Baekduia alba]|uniref:hypothetical protein n=1 Tax=Baekduia alba TaxID=2997333 RepID=UPI0023402D1D|nr:hypothetical protein [Baekduia alba]WCB96848.1 hypothetical protein DSM104299_05616 [Baekduia alba]